MNYKIKETILYVIFGVLTTLMNLIAYFILRNIFEINYLISNIIAWFLAILFAYFTNKKFVFKSNNYNTLKIIKELSSFMISRFATGLLDLAILYIAVDILHYSEYMTKIVSNVIVIILNYILSKFIIFSLKRNNKIKSIE